MSNSWHNSTISLDETLVPLLVKISLGMPTLAIVLRSSVAMVGAVVFHSRTTSG